MANPRIRLQVITCMYKPLTVVPIPYKYPIQGVLEVVKTVTLRVASICNRNLGIRHTVVNNPRLVFENYVKDMETFENYGCSYEDHITNTIDSIIQSDDHITDNHHIGPLYTSSKTLQASPELINDTSSDRLPAITHNRQHRLTFG